MNRNSPHHSRSLATFRAALRSSSGPDAVVALARQVPTPEMTAFVEIAEMNRAWH